MEAEDLNHLRARCDFAANFWWLVVSGLSAMTYREKGEPALHTLWFRLLSTHQSDHFKEGLRKLGIGGEPPAVMAAKYHYFSNTLGGLRLHYVEETAKKVWIRYLGPNGTFPGIAMLAVPGAVRRTFFSAWHPNNGRLLGCPRLGWVATKFTTEGDPYDEGYFEEHERDLSPEETLRYEVVDRTPEFDPAKAPQLDPVVWPEPRRLKAKRRFAEGYAHGAVAVLQRMYGEAVTNYLVQQTMRCLAVQYSHAFKSELGIDGSDAEAVARLFSRILDACSAAFATERLDATRHRIVVDRFYPFGRNGSEELCAAFFQFHQGAARMLNGRVRVTRESENGRDLWEIEDTGRWLW